METFDKVMASKILINFMAFDKFIFDKVKKLILFEHNFEIFC